MGPKRQGFIYFFSAAGAGRVGSSPGDGTAPTWDSGGDSELWKGTLGQKRSFPLAVIGQNQWHTWLHVQEVNSSTRQEGAVLGLLSEQLRSHPLSATSS